MDRFGVDIILPFEARVDTLVKLCERGHADTLVLSHDAACFHDWLGEPIGPAAWPNWHYLHIQRGVLPALRRRGVREDQINTMLVDNPRAIVEKQGSY